MMKVFLFVLSALGLILLPGCGAGNTDSGGVGSVVNGGTNTGGGGSTTPNNPNASQSVVPLRITLKDGIVRNATVRLASLLQGSLNVTAETDFGGVATLNIPSEIINSLATNDLVYVYGESTSNSTIDVKGFTQGLQAGQVKLRSYLPAPSYLKSVLASPNKLEDDTQVNKSTTVSHFTNAEAVLFDNELKKKGLLSSASSPSASITTNESLISVLTTLRSEIAKPNTPTIRKFKLIAASTKAIIEQNVSTILQGQTASITDPDQILFEIAANETATLEPSFESNILPAMQADVNTDLQSSEFASPLFDSTGGSDFTSTLATVSSEDMASSVDDKIELSDPQATLDDLVATSIRGPQLKNIKVSSSIIQAGTPPTAEFYQSTAVMPISTIVYPEN
ncbi:MAG: hypothetical protein KC646_12990 [Candidatus Cloacimonetes bacterium]|nr:hypothetical protein [Candidatus Cloacimonadota bacterium]